MSDTGIRFLERRHTGHNHYQFGDHQWCSATFAQAEEKVKQILEKEPRTPEELKAMKELKKLGVPA